MSKKWYNCPSCGKRCWVYAFFPQIPCLECIGGGNGNGGDNSAAERQREREQERERERQREREREREREQERRRQREREEREERERLRREREAEEARKVEEARKRQEEEEAKRKQHQAATPEFKRWLTWEARMPQYLANFEAAGAADEGFILDLDDEMLKEVIGIDNPIHRKRMMRVVAAYTGGNSVSEEEDDYAPYEPPSMPPPPKSHSSSSSRSVTSSARPVVRCAACCHYHIQTRGCSMCSPLSGAAAQEEADARPEEHIIFNIASSGKECPKPRQAARSLHLLRERCKACVGSVELAALVRVIEHEFGEYVAAVDGPCLKGEQRLREKLVAEYNGDHSKLLDLCRLRVRAKRLRTVASIFYTLQNHPQLQGLDIVYVKNRFATPSGTGHRDMALVLHHRQLDVLVEMQVAWEALAAGQKASHVTYERIREKEAEVELEKRQLAEEQERLFTTAPTVFSPKRKKRRG